MKKIFKNIKSKLENKVITAKSVIASTTAEGYIDSAVKIIIGVVIGGLLLAGLYMLFESNVLPELDSKIANMFNYAGEIE